MHHDIKKYVWDAIEACRLIQEFTKDYTLETYQQHQLTNLAVQGALVNLGRILRVVDEADPSFRNYLPETNDMIGLQKHLVHEYDRVDNAIIWNVAKNDVPDLQSKLTVWLEKNG